LFSITVLATIGCQGGTDETANSSPPPDKAKVTTAKASDAPKPAQKPIEQKPDPAKIWTERLAAVTAHLDNDELDAAQAAIDQLKQVYAEPQQPTAEQQQQLAEAERRLSELHGAKSDQARAEKLAEAEQLMNRGKFVEATQSINDVLARGATDEQRKQAGILEAEIERRRRARRDLLTWMQLLESPDRRDVDSARLHLFRDVDTALSLLTEATEQVDKPVLARNALSLLRQINRPEVTVPAILAVLGRSDQQENWPDAVSELGKFTVPGAGEPLLKLALGAEQSAQRSAALVALGQVVDPPPQTLAELLPLIGADGPELVAALQAARHAVTVHGQQDLLARRGLDAPLTDEQEAQLAALPQRLKAVIDAGPGEAAQAAKILACATQQTEPQPLEGVKVVRAHAEEEDGPAAAVLDGVWNSIELPTMWRHSIAQQSMIELDLGESRTVTGIRIWNFNEPVYTYRGWKDVDVYVGDSPARMRLVAQGIVPQAPGAADTPDYSTLVPVDFASGRYVRLVGKTTWQPNAYTGLAEVQILGF
jgi:hypothetical protein